MSIENSPICGSHQTDRLELTAVEYVRFDFVGEAVEEVVEAVVEFEFSSNSAESFLATLGGAGRTVSAFGLGLCSAAQGLRYVTPAAPDRPKAAEGSGLRGAESAGPAGPGQPFVSFCDPPFAYIPIPIAACPSTASATIPTA